VFLQIRDMLNDIIPFISTMIKRLFLLNDDMNMARRQGTVWEEFDFLDKLDDNDQREKDQIEKERKEMDEEANKSVFGDERYNYKTRLESNI
jgi:hypothetical protein